MKVPQLILSAFLFLVIFLSGFWLSRKGKPYSMLIQTLHKLVGVGLGVSLGLAVYYKHQVVPLSALEIIMIFVAVVLFAGLAATGGLLSADKTIPGLAFTHKILPYLAVISTGALIILLY